MAHFAYFNPGGIWGLETVVPHGFLQQLDQNLFKAINGDDGGTWAPSSTIVIGGSGLRLTTPFAAADAQFSGTVGLNHSVSIGTNTGDIFEVFSTSIFFGGAGFSAGLGSTTGAFSGALTGTTAAFSGALSTSAGLSVALGATFGTTASFAGLITATGGITATGASAFQVVTCNSTLNISGGATLSTVMIASAAGRVTKRATFATDAAGPTLYGPKDWDVVVVGGGGLSQDSIAKIDGTNAQPGDVMRFVNFNDLTHFLTVQNPSGGTIGSLKNASGDEEWMDVMLVSGSWIKIGSGKV